MQPNQLDDDIIDQPEAKRLCLPRSQSAWDAWHRRGVIPFFVPPGTNQRLYSRRALVAWIQSGLRGPEAA